MSLYVDDDFTRLTDLLAIDPEVGEVADAEGIQIEGEGGVSRQAWEECGDKLLGALQSFTSTKPRARLDQIVMSAAEGRKFSPIRRWLAYWTLALFYRAATNRRESDRYQRKFEQAVEDARRLWLRVCEAGIPVAWNAMPCPGSVHVEGAGEFGDSSVTIVPGDPFEGGTFLVATAWTDGERESGPSRVVAVDVPADSTFSVSIEGLTPPAKATGWNVYAGVSGGRLYRQNAETIPTATTSHVVGTASVLSGVEIGQGEAADTYLPVQSLLTRG